MLKIDQALTGDFIAQAFGLPIAHENAGYTPTSGTPWVALRMFQGEQLPGDIAAGTTETNGFLQFVLHYPQGDGAIAAKTQAQTISDAYPLGRRVTYSGVTVRVTRFQLFESLPEDGWFKVVGRIFYEKD